MARRLRISSPIGTVTARLVVPPDPLPVGILLAHGAGAGQDHPFMVMMRDSLAAYGYPTMTFNYHYVERGSKAPDRAPKLLAVHRAAADRLATYCDAVVLAGKSMGSRMGTHLVGDDGWDAAAVVSFGYPLVPIGKDTPRPTDHLRRIRCPQLYFAGTRDRLSPPALMARAIASVPAAGLVVVDGADDGFHVLKRSDRSDDDVLDELATTTTSWISALRPTSSADSTVVSSTPDF
ncbi:MAG TPA: hypothetical protein ENG98_03740 [Actinobacteria bacterium]|nr:hypothetical protein [Actinomycetota bacterium]